MAASSSSDPPPPASASRLAPGFRFHPTDEELVSYYLKRKVCGRPLRVDAVAEVDIYKCEPWDLPGLSRIRTRDLEWYFFSPLDRKYSNRSRTNRATPQGYWKTTGKDRPVRRGPRVVGMKKTLVFHAGRAPRGTRTNWVMHEYRLEDEQLTQAGVSQDAYVICRIFQKSGAGPQNGAQYGAPFLEEEWEAEEADGVVLMPDGGPDEFNEAAEQDYLHVTDFLQNEDLENQHVDASNFVPDVDRKHNSGFPENATVFQDEILDDPSFTNMVEYIDESGQKSSLAPIEGMEKKTVMEDCTHNPSPPNVKDEYVELNDLADTANVVHLYSEESVGYPIRNFHAQNMDGAGENSNLQKMFDVEEFFDAVSQNTEAEQSNSLRMAPLEDNVYSQQNDLNSVSGGCPSSQQLQDKMVFCDASDDLALRHGNVQLNGLLYSPTYGPSGFEMVDDLLAYFDATDDNLHYNTVGFSGSSECFDSSDHNFTGEVNCGYCPTSEATAEVPDSYVVGGASSSGSPIDDNQSKVNYEDVTVTSGMAVPDTNVAGGASSSGSSVAYNLIKVKYEDVNVMSDVQMNNVNDKTVGNRLVNMLGSISAPPAFAAEFPIGSGKSMPQISAATHSPSSIHVTAGFIHICGLPMSESAGLWSLRKNGNAGFILSYSTADDIVRKVAAPEPVMKNQVDAVSMMLGGGLYIFFLSALILTISYKVGMSIYGRAGSFMR